MAVAPAQQQRTPGQSATSLISGFTHFSSLLFYLLLFFLLLSSLLRSSLPLLSLLLSSLPPYSLPLCFWLLRRRQPAQP